MSKKVKNPVVRSVSPAKAAVPLVDMELLISGSPSLREIVDYMAYWKVQLRSFKAACVAAGVPNGAIGEVLVPLRAQYRLGIERMEHPVPVPIGCEVKIEE